MFFVHIVRNQLKLDTMYNMIKVSVLFCYKEMILTLFTIGEDRWLCTLLLQEGYRVEYCAASDALTYAPESFHVSFSSVYLQNSNLYSLTL